MTWDTTIYTLTRPLAIVAYTALIAAFVVNAIVLGMIGGVDQAQTTNLTWTLFAIAALFVASIIFTRASARRAISAAMPSGSSVRAVVGDKAIELFTKRGVSKMPYATFRAVRVGRHAVILLLRGASIVTTIPRSALSDADIAEVKSRV